MARARQHEGYLRCEHLLRAFDRALRLLAAATCGRYLEHLRSGGERILEADAVVAALVRPSLGQWVAIVRDATEALGQRGLVTAAFRAFVQKESPRLARIVELRNEREHAEDESRDEELEGLITSFLEAAAALPEMSLTASDAGGRVRIASAEIDLSPLVVGTPEGDDGVEVFLYHGRHRKKGTLVHMAASRGGTETIDDDKQLARSFDLLVQPGAEASRAIAARVTESPFRKLRAYSYRDAVVFRGREQSVRDVADLIDEKALVVLHAPSGTGKTSLLRAGVRPAIDDAFTWIEVEARGDVVALAADAVGHELALRGRPATGELAERIRVLAELTGRSVLLVVDALEELFRGSEADIDRRVGDFATAISSVLAAPDRCHVLLSIRADFFGQLERLREAGLERIFADTIALRPLDSAGARTALIEPLAAAGLTLGGKLAETIVRDLGGETQAVSAVELAIVGDALFERAKTAAPERPATIEPAVYASLGGAGEVLAAYVRGALAAFAPEERGDVQKLLTSMLGAAGVRLPPAGLAQIVERSRIDRPQAERLLGALVDARVVQTASAGDAPTFRISHDLVALELFGQLGEAERHALEVRESLETAARSWHLAGRPRSGFPAAKQLAYYEQASGVSRVAEEFLVGARRAATRRRRLERGALAVMAMLTIAASIAAVLAWRSTRARRVSLRDALASEAMALAQVPHRQKDAVVSALRAIALDGRPLAELDGRLTSALSRAASAAGAGARFVDLQEQQGAPSVGRFSPDGALVAVGDRSGEVSLFEARTGLRTRVLGQHRGGVNEIAFSADGRSLASAGADHAIHVWAIPTGEHTATLLGHYRDVWGLEFSPDGKRLASASEDGTARLWDVVSGSAQQVIRGHGVLVYSVDVSPEGSRIVVATMDGLARVIDRGNGRTLVELHPAHDEGYLEVNFASDGRISTASVDGTARVWDGSTGKLLATLTGHRSMVRTAVFSPLADRIATASVDGTLVVWNARTYQREREPIVHDGPITQAAFSQDGRKVATASYGGLVRVFDVETGREVQRLSHATDVWSVAFLPDDTGMLTTTFGATYLWSLASGRVQSSLVRSDKGKAINASVSRDGKWIAVGETWGVRLWNARTLEAVRYWPHGGNASVAFTPDGRQLVTGSTNRFAPAVRVFDVETGAEQLETTIGGGVVYDVAFDARGQLVTVGRDNAMRVWDPSTGAARAVLQPEEEPALGRAFSLDLAVSRSQPLAVVTTDRVSRAWDLDAKTLRWTTELLGHVAHDSSISPDGSLAIVGSRDETARILDMTTGALRAELLAPSVVRAVDLAADGRALVVSAANARIWLPDRMPLWATYRIHSHETPGVERVVLTPDGARIVTVSATGRLSVHDRVSGRRLWRSEEIQARDAAIVGDGKRLAAALDRDVALVDAADGRVLVQATGHADVVRRIAVSRDGKSVLSTDQDTVVSWAVDGDRLEQRHVDTSRSGIVSLAFSPDSRFVVLGLLSGEIEIVDASTWATVASRAGHRSDVNWVEVCDDGKHLVSAGFDQTARVWDMRSNAPPVVLRGHTGGVNEAHFIDGCTRVVTASYDQSIAVWNAATGERELVHTRLDGHVANSVAVTRDARDFVTGDGSSLITTGPLTIEAYLEAACAALEGDPRLGEFRAQCEAPLARLSRRPAWWSAP